MDGDSRRTYAIILFHVFSLYKGAITTSCKIDVISYRVDYKLHCKCTWHF